MSINSYIWYDSVLLSFAHKDIIASLLARPFIYTKKCPSISKWIKELLHFLRLKKIKYPLRGWTEIFFYIFTINLNQVMNRNVCMTCLMHSDPSFGRVQDGYIFLFCEFLLYDSIT